MFTAWLCLDDALEHNIAATSADDARFVAREWARGDEHRTAFISVAGSRSETILLVGWVGDGANGSGLERCSLQYRPAEIPAFTSPAGN